MTLHILKNLFLNFYKTKVFCYGYSKNDASTIRGQAGRTYDAYALGRFVTIYLCNEKLRLNVFQVNKMGTETYFEDVQKYFLTMPLYNKCPTYYNNYNDSIGLNLDPPEIDPTDIPANKFPGKLLHILMTKNMEFIPGWQNLYDDGPGTISSPPVFVKGEHQSMPRTTTETEALAMDPYFYFGDIYRKYCRYDFGM